MDDIAIWRKRIDEIDEKLVSLLNERAACAIEIGRIKCAKGLDIYNPVREKSIMDNIVKLNNGPLDKAAIQRLFGLIIEECREIENR